MPLTDLRPTKMRLRGELPTSFDPALLPLQGGVAGADVQTGGPNPS